MSINAFAFYNNLAAGPVRTTPHLVPGCMNSRSEMEKEEIRKGKNVMFQTLDMRPI
jgi:hypothetical protein